MDLNNVEEYKEIPLFQDMSYEEISTVLKATTEKEAMAGEAVFHEEDDALGLYIILSGRIEIRKKGARENHIVAELSDKAIFGEMALIGERPRSASAVAMADCRLAKIDKGAFEDLIQAGTPAAAKFAINMARVISARLDKVEQFLYDFVDEGREARNVQELDTFREKLFTEWTF